MGRSRFPGKPFKFQNRKRVSVLSGAVYHENAPESRPPTHGGSNDVLSGDKEEEEKKENNSEQKTNGTKEEKDTDNTINAEQQNNTDQSAQKDNKDSDNTPVRTRSQNKMDPPKEKPKKKTVTFGTVESCEDLILPLKKIPKHHAPLVSIIKKKKQTEYSSILKPAKLTDLSSKSSSEYQEGYLKKNLNPLSKSINKFSQLDNRCISPPPRNLSPTDREGRSSKFVLPVRSSHSSRVIKPNKRFIDGEEPATSSLSSGKVLKKPKLKGLSFNNLLGDESPDEDEEDKKYDKKQKLTIKASSLFKDKTSNLFGNLSSGPRKSVKDLFKYDNDEDKYSADENSNLEEMEKPRKHKEPSNSVRKLKDLSDASSSSSSESSSESEESSESDRSEVSGDEKPRSASPSPDREKSQSQLLRGKVIIREARLQLNSSTQSSSGLDGPFSSLSSVTSSNPPTTVTCGVCGAVRFYRFVKQARKFGIYSCESCRKFISKMLKKEKTSQSTDPVVMQCLKGEGNCHVPPIVRSQQWKLLRCANEARCPACWLKMCLKAFQVPPGIRAGLTAMLPAYMRLGVPATSPLAPANPLRTGTNVAPSVFGVLATSENERVFPTLKSKKDETTDKFDKKEESSKKSHSAEEDENDLIKNKKRRLTRVKVRKKDEPGSPQPEDPKRQKVELKGPRVKHVCRSASIVLGQPIATFPTQEEKEKTDKVDPDDEDSNSNNSVSILNKDRDTPSLSSDEGEPENKIPVSADVPAIKEAEEVETKKRKTEIQSKTSKIESSEDETSLELIPKKMQLKPLTNITNVRSRAQKCNQNQPELICVDFWESYDPDEVCNSGFGLIGTAPFTMAVNCFLCGSAGKEKMVVCWSCCEWYHRWCCEEYNGGAGWLCARCVSCASCNKPSARVRCRSCTRHYHASCLPPAPPAHRTDWPQICSTCLKCKSCDSSRVSKFVGSLPFCGPCFKLRQKGNYCPLCQACYRDNDFDSKMMECGWCSRWVHASCEGLSGEGYQLLSALPPSIEYICCKCMPDDPPWRKMLTEHLKGRLLHLLKLLAKNKKACALLKLTPHKNTPVPNKPYRISSPTAIRKLHFDEDMKSTSETKVYRNTSRGRRLIQKSDNLNSPYIWNCSPLLPSVEMNKEEVPHSSKVVNLQEPLMQNKEICFTAGLFGSKTEFDAPCVEVHENNPHRKTEKATTMLPTTVHDDKYEAISDDDEAVKEFPPIRSEQDLSPAICRLPMLGSGDDENNRIVSPSLLDIKKRVNSDEYVSLKDFNHDMKDVIERTCCNDLKTIYKDIFSETFPWFDCENNSLQPNLEVEGESDDAESLKDLDMSDTKVSTEAPVEKAMEQVVPKIETKGINFEEELLDFYPVNDSRGCVLCKSVGDGAPEMEGRLLYCGQNDWIHANCALWSAEVFEEIDGSLQNVHSAISRGKMIKCASCDMKGASVGCCAKNCSETYHYSCARKASCAFMDDKRVFCPAHGKDVPKKCLQKDADFELTRPVYVELDKKKKRYAEINKVQFLLGSLSVQTLGKIIPSVSDFEEFLIPVDFSCTRLFWSSKKPSKVVRYKIKTKLILAEPLPGFDFGVNITVDHSMEAMAVERVMAEIGAWHESLEYGPGKTAILLKSDKSPIKFRNVTLEDFAVKQVVEYLLDNVCKQEQQQDEEEPQNTADLLPPELKDAIFEDLNHDLLDGISMQDIFPKLMSYEDLVAIDLKSEFYGAMSQSDDKSSDKSDSRDYIDELLNARLESGNKELKRSKSEMLLQNHGLKSLTTGRGQQRSSSLTWNNKFDTTLLTSTIKRCKMGRNSTVTGKMSPVQKASTDGSLVSIKEESVDVDKKIKSEASTSNSSCDEAPHGSSLEYRTTSPKDKEETGNEKTEKPTSYFPDVIDFYTKIQCSPISQLDGAADWSGSESTCSSRPSSPRDENEEFTPINQLDGADDNNLNDIQRNHNGQFMYRASGSENTYTVTIAGNSLGGHPELVMKPLDEISVQNDQPVRCDRCQCTYRNKESYDRHVPSCDMMSTSESESENPRSPDNRTLTTLQNAFQGAFAQPMIIHAGVVSGTENTVKAEGISARRTSINTRQITINGTIVETPSPGPSNDGQVTMTITEQMKTGTVFFDQSKTTNVQVSANQQIMSSPQIVVTPQMLLHPKTSSANNQKIMAPQIITQPGILPYNICVKPGNGNTNIQQIQGSDMAQFLAGPGGIQVISSNSNQVLTIPQNQQGNITPIVQGKNQVTNFPNMASASSISLPVNSLHGMPNTSILQNIQPMIRPQMQGNTTIVVPAMTTRLGSPNSQKTQLILPNTSQKSPKKQPTPVQPKPIFQAANRGRGRPVPKPTTIKRQTKLEKTFTTINQSPMGPGNTVIQLQTNNQNGQPSIIVQPMANQNIMSAYVEALSQQQNQNMQYIATIAPQGEFKAGPQFISNSGLVPQTFQIQQTENGGLVAVPSGGGMVLLPQGNVGILPQTIQQGATILPQGTLQQGIISQGPNGPTILPQTLQNGATIIPQGTIQGLTSQTATLLPNNTLQTAGATVVPQSGIGNGQTTILPNQGNTLISNQGATILPQGTLLPQFCNDQVLLGSTPTLEMVTDQSGCMYLTATQPVYYGLETIVQNTVMSSQQFVSTAMQGVLAQNSSFSATTTQVFQASKIEPIVEVPTGYVVVNNVGDGANQTTSTSNVVAQTVSTVKNTKAPVPNLTLQPLPDKSNNNRQTAKVIQMSHAQTPISSQAGINIISSKSNVINPITSQIHGLSLASMHQAQHLPRSTVSRANVSMPLNVTLVSSTGQPVMAISQSIPNTPFSIQPIPISQPIVSSSIAPSMNKHNIKIENSPVIEISGNLQDSSNSSSMPTISVTQSIKSPTPWRQVSNPNSENKMEQHNIILKTSASPMTSPVTSQSNILHGKHNLHEMDKVAHNNSVTMSSTGNSAPNLNIHQFDSNVNVSHHSVMHSSPNVIQISAGNIYPSSSFNTSFDAETALKLSKINALSKAEGGHLNFSQEIMNSHAQSLSANENKFQNENKHDIHKLHSCQVAGSSNNTPVMNISPHGMMRSQNQNMIVTNNQNQMGISSSNSSHGQALNAGNNSMQNINMSCQEMSNNRLNITVSSESNMQQNVQQFDVSNSMPHGNMQIISQENNHHSTPSQIHVMNSQMQHNRHESNQIQLNQGQSARAFHDQHIHNQTNNMLSNRSTPDNVNIINQNLSIHNMNNHNINRQQSDMNHIHMQQPNNNMNLMQNNRMMVDGMQSHGINSMTHQMHANRTMENQHNQQMHNMQQMNHHMNSNTTQMDNKIHVNQQLPAMNQNRQMDSMNHHHQHFNAMQMQINRPQDMSMHQHMSNQMHDRQQIDNTMHLHHLSGNNTNMPHGTQIENSNSMQNLHDNMSVQNFNSLNQMQGNRTSMDHQPHLQHQLNMNMSSMNVHANVNSSIQMQNQSMNNQMVHGPNIPDIKTELNQCAGPCSNNQQFSNNQNTFDMCSSINMNSSNMNMNTGSMMHGVNINNSNMMMGSVNNSGVYNQNNLSSHEMLMNCNNSTENVMTPNNNHMMMNTQPHTNVSQPPMVQNQLQNNTQINISSCSMQANNASQSQMPNIESQMSRNTAPVNDTPKFPQDPIRGKNMGQSPTTMTPNDKQNHAISVNNQIGYMQLNSQNNRAMNTNIGNAMNQHVSQQHNIRVVTNNANSNLAAMNTDPFLPKTENNSTMINVPFQTIPNSAPMNINVNSSNNTVNITVQNNLVDPKIASKGAEINFPIPTNTNIIQNQNSTGSMICIPVQNSTINLPTQNSSSISLPKAPPTQQSGIPTNVVNPMSMRPMNRVLPLHRDGQNKSKSSASTTPPVQRPRPVPVSHDMPDLNVKEENNIDSDIAKAIEESKRLMELERVKKEKEERDAARALQLSTEFQQANNTSTSPSTPESVQTSDTTPKMPSLPSLDEEMIEIEPPKVLVEKDTNKSAVEPKISVALTKVMKRPLEQKKTEVETVVNKKHSKVTRGQENKAPSSKQVPDPSKDDGPKLIYEVTSEDGFIYSSPSLSDLWAKVVDAVQVARKQAGLPPLQYNLPSTLYGAHLLGLNNNALKYLIEQLPGASRCNKYKARQGRQLNSWDNDLEISEGFKESPWGSARLGPVDRKPHHDMFSWMASPFRQEPPPFGSQESESSISRRLATLPLAMRFRQLKETAEVSVGVYRSHIHGRGLFCKREIEEGDMVIEYAGEVIRAVLADQREKKYEAMSGRRGVGGCYMFRIDDNLVVDATLKGNAARFINHSCDPNCYSRVVDIHGHKHILIFALRRISVGEELTYDYKFPFEEVKIPCTCGAKKCRKYLN